MVYKQLPNPLITKPLSGERLIVFRLLREPHSPESLAQEAGLPLEAVQTYIEMLVDDKLIDRVDVAKPADPNPTMTPSSPFGVPPLVVEVPDTVLSPDPVPVPVMRETSPGDDAPREDEKPVGRPGAVAMPEPAPIFKPMTFTEPVKPAEPNRLEVVKRELIGSLDPRLGKRIQAEILLLSTAKDLDALEQAARRLVPKLKLLVDRKMGDTFGRKVEELLGR